jgi:hypothetical protein
MLFREGRVRIHGGMEFRERLLQQMREVQGRPTAGGGMSIMHPRWAKGGHGDLVAALVLALWQLYGDEVKAPAPKPGTPEHEAVLKADRAKAFREEAERPYWKRGATQAKHWRRS